MPYAALEAPLFHGCAGTVVQVVEFVCVSLQKVLSSQNYVVAPAGMSGI